MKPILESLQLISKLGLITNADNRILRTYKSVYNFGMASFFGFIYTTFHKTIEANLLSNHPKLMLLDIYKLSYFCKINAK